jgi:hypothetical protein
VHPLGRSLETFELLVGFGMPPLPHRPPQQTALFRPAVCLDHPIDAREAGSGVGRIGWHASITVAGTGVSHLFGIAQGG